MIAELRKKIAAKQCPGLDVNAIEEDALDNPGDNFLPIDNFVPEEDSCEGDISEEAKRLLEELLNETCKKGFAPGYIIKITCKEIDDFLKEGTVSPLLNKLFNDIQDTYMITKFNEARQQQGQFGYYVGGRRVYTGWKVV